MITTRPSSQTVLALAMAAFLVLGPWLSARADSEDQRAVEAGPEDGFLCCNGFSQFLFQENQVLAATGRAGIFRSNNRGESWYRSMDGFVGPNGVSPYVEDICQSPSNPRVAYALAGILVPFSPFNGIFSSDDFGKTWTRRAAMPADLNLNTCRVDPSDPRTVYVVTTSSDFVDEVWKSTDGGDSVQLVGSPGLFLEGFGRGTVYFGDDFLPGLVASNDGGITRHSVPMPPGFFDGFVGFFLFASSPDGGVIFVTTFDNNFNVSGTFRSTDVGASYVPVSGLPIGAGGPTSAFDPTDPSRIYVSDSFGGLLRVSIDGGLSFASLPASNDPRFVNGIQEISIDQYGSVYVNTAGGLFRTDDRGQTFRPLLNNLRASSVDDLGFDADGRLLVAVTHTKTLFRQTNGLDFQPIGVTPAIQVNSFSNDAHSVAASPRDASVILVATFGQGLFRTADGGHSWTNAAVTGSPAFYFNTRMAFANPTRVYLASPQVRPGLYRSDDAGQTFALLTNQPVGALAVDPRDPNVLYLGDYAGASGLFKSIDGGQTLANLGQPGSFTSLLVDRKNSGFIYAGERFGQVLRSRDGGRTFSPASSGLRGAGVHGIVQDAGGTLFVWVRGGGLFASHDAAATWHPVDTDEALKRSGVEAGRGTLVADPRQPGVLYLGNAGVIRIDAEDDQN